MISVRTQLSFENFVAVAILLKFNKIDINKIDEIERKHIKLYVYTKTFKTTTFEKKNKVMA